MTTDNHQKKMIFQQNVSVVKYSSLTNIGRFYAAVLWLEHNIAKPEA